MRLSRLSRKLQNVFEVDKAILAVLEIEGVLELRRH